MNIKYFSLLILSLAIQTSYSMDESSTKEILEKTQLLLTVLKKINTINDKELTPINGDTVVHNAAADPEISSELLEHYLKENSDLANIGNKEEEIPLHSLAKSCFKYENNTPELEKKAAILLRYTKNPTIKNHWGETAFEYAENCAKHRSSFLCKRLAYILGRKQHE